MRRLGASCVFVLSLSLLLPSRAAADGGGENLARIAVQKDGKVVLVGETDVGATRDIAVARLTRNGALDPQFGTGGRVVIDLGAVDEGGAVAIDKRRRILVAGDTNSSGGYDFVVARLTKDGSLDPTFGTNGVTVIDLGGASESVRSVAVDRKGRILLAGFVNPSANWQWGLVRLTKNGALDATFGSGGKVYADFGSGTDFGYDVVVDRKGRITVTGITGDNDFVIARYDDSGTLDPEFGTAGLATADFGADDDSYAVVLGKKRTVLVAGRTGDGTSSFAAARFDRDGALDPAFGADGKVVVPFAGGARAAALDTKGRAYLGGFAVAGGFAAARLLEDGSLDPDFGTAGVFTTDAPGSEIVRHLALGKRKTVFLAGESAAGGTVDMAVLQLDKNGVPVPGFNGGEIVLVDF